MSHKHLEQHCIGMDGAGYCNRLTAIGIYMCSRRAKAALHCECGVCGGGLTVFVVQVDVAERHAVVWGSVTLTCNSAAVCNQAFPTVAAITTSMRCSP